MKLIDKRVTEFLDEISSKKPTPGGGSASAMAGSMAAALVGMVGRLTGTERAKAIIKESDAIRIRLTNLIDEDSEAFIAFMKAPPTRKQESLRLAAIVPVETTELSYRILQMADELVRTGNKNAITDAGVACLLADAAIRGAMLNVRINLRYIKDQEFKDKIEAKVRLYSDSVEKRQATMKYVMEHL